MASPVFVEPVDYLVIGHVAHDLTPVGPRLGGTVAYASLTARALGLRVGAVTAFGKETSLEALNGIPIASIASPQSTTFENIYTERGRVHRLISIVCLKPGGARPLSTLLRLPTKWIPSCQKGSRPRCLGSLHRAGCVSGMLKVAYPHIRGQMLKRR